MVTLSFFNKEFPDIICNDLDKITFGQFHNNIIEKDKCPNLKFYYQGSFIESNKELGEYSGKKILLTGCSSKEYQEIKKSISEFEEMFNNKDDETISLKYSEDEMNCEIKDVQFENEEKYDEDRIKNELIKTNNELFELLDKNKMLGIFIKTFFEHPEYLNILMTLHDCGQYNGVDKDFEDIDIEKLKSTLKMIYKELDDSELNEVAIKSGGNIYKAIKLCSST